MKPLKIAVSVLLLISSTAALHGQGIYFPYFGKNRVLYEKFPWKTYPTEHFQLHFYTDNLEALKNLASVCESAYRKVSRELKHELRKPVPILYYTTFTDFEQSNVFDVSEGIMGVSEPVLQRIGLHGDLPLDGLQVLIDHELTHIFQFDILWGNQGRALYALSQPPLWTFEGLSELNTGTWSPWSVLILRDAVFCDRVPEFSDSGDLVSRYPLPREPAYDFGHAIYEYLKETYGPNAVQDLWKALRTPSRTSLRDPLQRAFNVKPKDFGFAFRKYLRERFRPFQSRENPEDYSIALGPEFPLNPFYFAFSHALSPSGDIVAAITYNVRDYKMDIVLISAKDGSVLKDVTRGYTTSYEYIKYDVDPTQGRFLAWSPDGDDLAFFARDGRRYSLFVIEAFSGRLVRKYRLEVDQPASPSYAADGRRILFTAFHRGVHDIYGLDLGTGGVDNLTRDALFEKAPAVSPDGSRVAFSVRLGTEDKLFIAPLDDLAARRQLTFGPGSAIAPQFAPDGRSIYYSGDARGSFNIYSLDLETGRATRYTDVRTGNFLAQPRPQPGGGVVFASFHKGSFQIFRSRLEAQEETVEAPAEAEPAEVSRPFAPVVNVDISPDKIAVTKGLGQLYLTSRPPIDAVVATDGSIFGGSSISFADILGNHNFNVLAYQARSFRSYFLSYFNRANRLQFGLSAFEYTLFYYPDYVYYDPSFFSLVNYQDAIATRTVTALNWQAYYPLNRYYRLEFSFGYFKFEEDYLDPALMRQYLGGRSAGFVNGSMVQASLAFVGETTTFKEYGPVSGYTFSLTAAQALPFGRDYLRNTTLEADVRGYLNLGYDFLIALRLKAFASLGRNPFLFFFGGNNEVRSANYYSLVGSKAWFGAAELRFPLVRGISTIIGNLGPARGVIFLDLARAQYGDYPARFYIFRDALGLEFDAYDALGSIGYGFEMFFLGLPIHLEFVKRLYVPDMGRPWDIKITGDFQTRFWIGFDF
jgi:Tol biopolymer transport system component